MKKSISALNEYTTQQLPLTSTVKEGTSTLDEHTTQQSTLTSTIKRGTSTLNEHATQQSTLTSSMKIGNSTLFRLPFFLFSTKLPLVSVESSSNSIKTTALSSLVLSTIETIVFNQRGISSFNSVYY
jgi:hypothetical protein